MAITYMPTPETDFDNPMAGGGAPPVGLHHCQVHDVIGHPEETGDDGNVRGGYYELKLEVVGPTAAGARFTERLYYIGKDDDKTASAQKRCFGFYVALGMIDKAAYEAALAAGQPISMDFEGATGRQAIFEFKDRVYADKSTGEKKSTVQIPFNGIYHLGDPTKAHVALDPELAAIYGVQCNPDGSRVGGPALAVGDNPFGNPKANGQAKGNGAGAGGAGAANKAAQRATQPPAATGQGGAGGGAVSGPYDDI